MVEPKDAFSDVLRSFSRLAVVGTLGGNKDAAVRKLLCASRKEELSVALLDWYGGFDEDWLARVDPPLSLSSVFEYLPVAVATSCNEALRPRVEAVVHEAMANIDTFRQLLTALAARAGSDTAAKVAYGRLSSLSAHLTKGSAPTSFTNVRVDLSTMSIPEREVMQALWVVSLSKVMERGVLVVGGASYLAEAPWIYALFDEMATHGNKVVLVDETIRRRYLRYGVIVTDASPEISYCFRAFWISAPLQEVKEGKALLLSGSRYELLDLGDA